MTLPDAPTCEVCAVPLSDERLDELRRSSGVPNTCSPKCARKRRLRRADESQRRRGVRQPPRERATPTLGPLAKAAMRVETGSKRRKLLVLIATYADAGEESPAAGTLAAKLGRPVPVLDALLAALEREGLLEVERRPPPQRNAYRVVLQ